MRLVFVSVVAGSIAFAPMPSAAQSGERFELSGLVGTAHTVRTARLGSERATEPFGGLRFDARLWSLGGGRAGLAVGYDYYRFSDSGLAPGDLCMATCALSQSSGSIPWSQHGSDKRLLLGLTWQRALGYGLRLQGGANVGLRQAKSGNTFGGNAYESEAPKRSVYGGEVGLSSRLSNIVVGLNLQHDVSRLSSAPRRQDRVSLRLGYAWGR